MKKIIFIIMLLFSISSYCQLKNKDFFGKWEIIQLSDSKNDSKQNEEKFGLKTIIDDKIRNEKYYFILSKNKIEFYEGTKKTETHKITRLKQNGDVLEISVQKLKSLLKLKNNKEGELIGDGYIYYIIKQINL